MTSRPIRAAALVVAAVALAGCWEEPYRESLTLRFQPRGGVEIELRAEMNLDPLSAAESPSARRLQGLRRAFEEGWDPWTPRFEALDPASESYSWSREKGELVLVERRATLTDPAGLDELFRDSAGTAVYDQGEGWAGFSLYPGSSARASREERRTLDKAVEAWSEDLAIYFDAAATLYSYLSSRPERAEALFAELFDLTHPDVPSTEEEEILETLEEAMLQALDRILSTAGDEERSLQEISRRVHDPFPARLDLELPGPVLELEGFADAGGGSLTVPGLGLWEAFLALEGRWLTPDPLAVWMHHLRTRPDDDFDLPTFLARDFEASPAPEPEEIQYTIESLLAPAPVYRVVWGMGTVGGDSGNR